MGWIGQKKYLVSLVGLEPLAVANNQDIAFGHLYTWPIRIEVRYGLS